MVATETQKKCPRVDSESGNICGKSVTGKHPWCTKCRTQYQNESAVERDIRTQRLWFSRGIEAFRKALVDELERVRKVAVIPDQVRLTLFESIEMVRRAPSPPYPDGRSVDPNGNRILG